MWIATVVCGQLLRGRGSHHLSLNNDETHLVSPVHLGCIQLSVIKQGEQEQDTTCVILMYFAAV